MLLRAGVLMSSSCTLSNTVTSTQTLPLSFFLPLSHPGTSLFTREEEWSARHCSSIYRPKGTTASSIATAGADVTVPRSTRACTEQRARKCGSPYTRRKSCRRPLNQKEKEKARKEPFGPLWLENLRRCLKLMLS